MIKKMILGSGFGEKNQRFLEHVAHLSEHDTERKISVKEINEGFDLDRVELKNRLEYLENLGYLIIKTIGGPWLYGHISITPKGLEKASNDDS